MTGDVTWRRCKGGTMTTWPLYIIAAITLVALLVAGTMMWYLALRTGREDE